jgi:hypothetical protein
MLIGDKRFNSLNSISKEAKAIIVHVPVVCITFVLLLEAFHPDMLSIKQWNEGKRGICVHRRGT